jgi:quercetin 2,3-dioxygenase
MYAPAPTTTTTTTTTTTPTTPTTTTTHAAPGETGGMRVTVTESHVADVAGTPVRRALPRRGRRTVGPWCFVDHIGPLTVDPDRGPDIGPHPHMGLQTVTWLLAGELLHLDSLGSEQPIRSGELNLMTAGHGVAHAEESMRRHTGELHGVQLWVAQPDATRDGEPAFEHHGELPRLELPRATISVLVGRLEGTVSPARRDSDHVGADVSLRPGTTTVPVDTTYEHGLVPLDGPVRVGGHDPVGPGHLVHVEPGPDELDLLVDSPTRVLLVGGVPFDEDVLMWWNFVARTRDEISDAYDDWSLDTGRFAPVASRLPRIPTVAPLWHRRQRRVDG